MNYERQKHTLKLCRRNRRVITRIVELISIIVLVLMQTPSASLAQLRLKFLGIYSYEQQVTVQQSGQCGEKYRYTDTSNILIAVNGKPISNISDVSPSCGGYFSIP